MLINPAMVVLGRGGERRMRSSFSLTYKLLDWAWLFLVIISTVLTVRLTKYVHRSEIFHLQRGGVKTTAWRFGPNINMRNRNHINRLHGLIFFGEAKYLLHSGQNKFEQRQNKEKLTRQMIKRFIIKLSNIYRSTRLLCRYFLDTFIVYCGYLIEGVRSTVI